ncbi:MAG TPA: hypothetical protein VGF77_10520 [Allosphingosinicella sp.]|jgi:hypothetical protein
MAYQDGDFGPFGGFASLDQNGLPLPQPDAFFAADQGDGDTGAAPYDPSQGSAPGVSAPAAGPDQLVGQIAQAKDAFVNATHPVQQVNALWQLGSLIMVASQQPQQGGGSSNGGADADPSQPAFPFSLSQDQQDPSLGSDGGTSGAPQQPLPPPMLGQPQEAGGGASDQQSSDIPLLPADQQNPPPFVTGLPGVPGGVASAIQQLAGPPSLALGQQAGPQGFDAGGTGGTPPPAPSLLGQGPNDDAAGQPQSGIPLQPSDPPNLLSFFVAPDDGGAGTAVEQLGAKDSGYGGNAPLQSGSLFQVATLDNGGTGPQSPSLFNTAGQLGMPQTIPAVATVGGQGSSLPASTPAAQTYGLLAAVQPSGHGKPTAPGRPPAPARQAAPPTNPFSVDNLNLGPNEKYRDAIVAVTKTSPSTPVGLAGLIGGEAQPGADGKWDPHSANSESSAQGLGQFTEATWLGETERRGSHLNDIAFLLGLLDKNGKVDPAYKHAFLKLRYDPNMSIIAANDYARYNLSVLEKKHLILDHSPAALMEYAYLAHHEGLQGAIDDLEGTRHITNKLWKNVPANEQSYWLKTNGSDRNQAYIAWLAHYVSLRVNPLLYMKDTRNVTVPPPEALYRPKRPQPPQR